MSPPVKKSPTILRNGCGARLKKRLSFSSPSIIFETYFYMIYIINKYVFILLYTYILHSSLRWSTFFWTSLCGLCRCRRYISVWRPADDKPWLSSTRVEALLFTYYSLKSDLLYISTVFLCMYSYIIYSPDPIRSQRTSGCFPWKSGIEASV